MNFYLLTLMLLGVCVCGCCGDDTSAQPMPEAGDVVRTYLGVSVYKTERACARLGGLCVHKTDCQSPSTMSGLCPGSAHRGVECCYEVLPPKGLRCHQYRGRCVEWCLSVDRVPAGDCDSGRSCCAPRNQ
ncbi:U-scoloptoxin(19)-Sm1a isoform X1 [Malaya genurostris]|uniref:U-scoloptoxin(19)-Sm1a isoform X1 n=1 Tax=Malaya genurostris TaxID=325434 RepID=UPI0026F38EC4|nr:U-scoloptoxin(19)-Sm1a isoform X1 [Malaya genurostris]